MSEQMDLKARLKEELENPTIPMVTMDEYKALQEYTKFVCPNHRNRYACDGRSCPTRKDDPWEDHHDECRRSVQAEIKLESIGKTRELYQNGLW